MGVCLERGVGDVTCMKGFVPGNLLAHQGAKLEPQCFCAASGCVLWMIPPEEATEEALGSTWEDDSSTAAGPKPPFEVGVSPLPQQPCVEAFECQVAGFAEFGLSDEQLLCCASILYMHLSVKRAVSKRKGD